LPSTRIQATTLFETLFSSNLEMSYGCGTLAPQSPSRMLLPRLCFPTRIRPKTVSKYMIDSRYLQATASNSRVATSSAALLIAFRHSHHYRDPTFRPRLYISSKCTFGA
jgi:hypothetical protein